MQKPRWWSPLVIDLLGELWHKIVICNVRTYSKHDNKMATSKELTKHKLVHISARVLLLLLFVCICVFCLFFVVVVVVGFFFVVFFWGGLTSATDIVNGAYPTPSVVCPSSSSVVVRLPSVNLFSNRIGSLSCKPIFPIFRLDVYNNITPKHVQLRFRFYAYNFQWIFLL